MEPSRRLGNQWRRIRRSKYQYNATAVARATKLRRVPARAARSFALLAASRRLPLRQRARNCRGPRGRRLASPECRAMAATPEHPTPRSPAAAAADVRASTSAGSRERARAPPTPRILCGETTPSYARRGARKGRSPVKPRGTHAACPGCWGDNERSLGTGALGRMQASASLTREVQHLVRAHGGGMHANFGGSCTRRTRAAVSSHVHVVLA